MPDRGAELPDPRHPASEDPASDQHGQPSAPARILVMEDDPSVRSLLDILLESEGYEVVTASDGLAGLRQATAHRPALVLLDVMMPDLDGMQVLHELRADPALVDVPVIAVTGQVEAVDQLATVLGDASVFVKPFGVAELLARVAVLTEKADPS
jgi:DNA-binding response OmpR family regulator